MMISLLRELPIIYMMIIPQHKIKTIGQNLLSYRVQIKSLIILFRLTISKTEPGISFQKLRMVVLILLLMFMQTEL
ncbi:hypothetical protein ES703_103214 [subsurface metagenome]